MKRILLTGGGFTFLALGAVGLFIPVWPTTPFILLALGCFSGMPAMRERILRVGFIREHYENYQSGHGLRRSTLLISLAFLWGMLLVSMLITQKMIFCCLLTLVGLAVTAHLLYIARSRGKVKGDGDK